MPNPENVIVVIPLYTTSLDSNELLSLKRTADILARYRFAIVCPETLDLSPLNDILGNLDLITERFDDSYFKGVAGYNRLMLSTDFYKRFNAFDYMLICQTDVFVFSDKLMYWCEKGYDYVGAPWIASKRNLWNKALFELRNLLKKKKRSTAHFFKVGNGGFSLRKVATFDRIVHEQRENIDRISQNPNRHHHHIEDVYFSLVAPTLTKMTIPDYKEAVDFCIDRKPHIALKLNGNRLPFACHGFNKPKVWKFWQEMLKKFPS